MESPEDSSAPLDEPGTRRWAQRLAARLREAPASMREARALRASLEFGLRVRRWSGTRLVAPPPMAKTWPMGGQHQTEGTAKGESLTKAHVPGLTAWTGPARKPPDLPPPGRTLRPDVRASIAISQPPPAFLERLAGPIAGRGEVAARRSAWSHVPAPPAIEPVELTSAAKPARTAPSGREELARPAPIRPVTPGRASTPAAHAPIDGASAADTASVAAPMIARRQTGEIVASAHRVATSILLAAASTRPAPLRASGMLWRATAGRDPEAVASTPTALLVLAEGSAPPAAATAQAATWPEPVRRSWQALETKVASPALAEATAPAKTTSGATAAWPSPFRGMPLPAPLMPVDRRGVDLNTRLQLPAPLAQHGLDWLMTATRGVRVHTDELADRAARRLGADALTVGDHIFMRAGRFDPATPRGLALLSHELTHVAQQRENGGALATLGPTREVHEREALAVEHTVLALLQPARPASAPGAPRAADRLSNAATRSAPPSAEGRAVPFRADEDRPAPPAAPEGPATDTAEMAGEIYRVLLRRLRIDRERAGLGRA